MKNFNAIPAKTGRLVFKVVFTFVKFTKGPVVLGQALKVGWKAEEA